MHRTNPDSLRSSVSNPFFFLLFYATQNPGFIIRKTRIFLIRKNIWFLKKSNLGCSLLVQFSVRLVLFVSLESSQ